MAVSGQDQYGRDDDEDQHSAVLWLSNRKVEVKEPEEKEHETFQRHGGAAVLLLTT